MALTAPPQTRTPEKTAEAHRFDAEALGRLSTWLGTNVAGCHGGEANQTAFLHGGGLDGGAGRLLHREVSGVDGVHLLEVVTVKELPGVQAINRRSRSRAVNIYSGIMPGKSQGEALENVKTIVKKYLPPGYTLVESGAAETYKEAFSSLIFALLMGILISYMVLGTQFNSFIDPVTVLLALPFSFSGAFLALWVTGESLNLYSMIGLILLMGIVKKNSILLVDFTNQRRNEGLSIRDALMDACPKRLRPIMMTTFSTVAGAVPLALAWGAGAESLRPMAIAIIGGSIVSTLLTLVVVPASYLVMGREKKS